MKNLFPFILVFIFSSCHPKPDWLIYYGDKITTQDLKQVTLAILEPDHIVPNTIDSPHTAFYAYYSLGEIHASRPYFEKFKTTGLLHQPNPEWPQAFAVNIAHQDYQKFILQELIPEILNKGYSGIFLDTLDTSIYLEEVDPIKFKGYTQATIDIIKKIHQNFPQLKIMVNNGLKILPQIQNELSAWMIEDLFARFDTASQSLIINESELISQRLAAANEFKKNGTKPVYTLIYSNGSDRQTWQRVAQLAQQYQIKYQVTTHDLMTLPE